jgi:hypothetical protein
VPGHGATAEIAPADSAIARVRWSASLLAQDRGAWAHNLSFTRATLDEAARVLREAR